MAKYVQIESLYLLNKNRKQNYHLEKYREFLDRQECQHLKEFHHEKAKLKKFLHTIHTTTGSLKETSLATRKLILHGRVKYQKETTSLQEPKRRNSLGSDKKDLEDDNGNGTEDSADDEDDLCTVTPSKSYSYAAAQIQARARTNASRRSSCGSLSSHYSTLAESLNTKIRVLKPLPVVQSNKQIFSQFQNLDKQLTYGSLSRQRTFRGPRLPKEGAVTNFRAPNKHTYQERSRSWVSMRKLPVQDK